MPQAPLKKVWALALLALAVIAPRPACGAAGVVDPHLDSTLLRDGCRACHRGHGVSRSPMLPGSQLDTCLQCHGSLTSRNRQLDSLEALADGLECELVYALVPRQSIQSTLEQRATELAGRVVRRVSTSMELEEQGVPEEEKRRQIEELAAGLLRERPRRFWDD